MVDQKAVARARLEQRLAPIRVLANEPRPRRGWIRAIRDALGMSSTELAARMGIRQQVVTAIEQSEARGTVKVETLQRAAEALDCDLVYFLVPRRNLEEMVQGQARQQARRYLAGVAHHSRQEDQSVSEEDTEYQVDDLAQRFVDRRGLWTEADRRP